MKRFCLFPLLFTLAFPVCASDDIQLGSAKLHFASQIEGAQILTSKNDFTQRLSPFDRSARMKTDKSVSEPEFLAFVRKNVLAWDDSDIEKVRSAATELAPLLHDLPVPLPTVIHLVKTTGDEEGQAAYTQGTAIVLPKIYFAKAQVELAKVICHELFHIISRQNPELRERLYQAIGFYKCNEIQLPPDLLLRKITNPDAPRNDHYIKVKVDGKEALAVPILLSSSEKYDPKRGGEFFDYLQFKLLLVQKEPGSQIFRPALNNKSPQLIDVKQVSGFFEQVGRNTDYIIHPEEILAENFALLRFGGRSAPSPEILEKMRLIFLGPAL